MLDGGGIQVRSRAGLGLGRLSLCHVCSDLGGGRCSKSDMFCYDRMLARVVGDGLLCGGLLLYVLPL